MQLYHEGSPLSRNGPTNTTHRWEILLLHSISDHQTHQCTSPVDIVATSPHSPHAVPDGARATAKTECAPTVILEISATDGEMTHILTICARLLLRTKGAIFLELLFRIQNPPLSPIKSPRTHCEWMMILTRLK